MLRQLRRKLASSVSVIQEEEDFLHNSWLRVPPHDSVAIGQIFSRILDTSYVTFSIEKPFLSKLFFKLGKTTLYPEDLNYLFGKVKTNPVFFQFLQVASNRDVDVKFNLQEPTGYSFMLTEPDIKDYLQNLKAKVEKIELLNREDFLSEGNFKGIEDINVRSFGKLKVKKLKVEKICKIPKLYKIKVPGMGKYRATISNLNLPPLKIAAVSKSPLLNFTPPSVSSQSLSFLSTRTINNYMGDAPKAFRVPGAIVDEVNESTIRSEEVKLSQKSEKIALSQKSEEIKLSQKSEEIKLSQKSEEIELSQKSEEIELSKKSEEIELSQKSEEIELSQKSEEIELSQKSEEIELSQKSEEIKRSQKTSQKVEWEEGKNPEIIVNKFEEENTRFLAENDRAFLAVEPGLNKIKESFAALKLLFQNKVINSTLIVLPAGFLGHSEKAKQLGVSLGWIDNLEKYCYDMSYSVISGDDNERLNAWNKSALIHIVDHKTFLNDHSSNILEKQRLANFDCVIIDEVQELLNSSDKSKNVLKEINSNIFWALSSIAGDNILSLLNEYLNDNCRIEERKVRFLTDAAEEDAVINHQEFWLEPNENQRIEYKETLVECRKELKIVLESGNPFRYQSNIFILVHKLFQVQNYAHGYDTSPKSDLLLQHIKAIERNQKKVIVISQYDRQGTKQIEELFDQHKISYITVPTSLSSDEMEKAVSLFKSRKSITVFLTNAKISRLNFRDFIVPYIIRFDSWWNPAMLWQTKNLFDISESNNEKNVVNVFTYKMFDTIDELIKGILISKNFIDDNLISAMSPTTVNDLISIDEWLKVFDMPVNDEQENFQELYEETVEKLNNLSLADYRETLSRFFFTVGYAKIKILKHKNSESFDITGEGKSGNQNVYLFSKVLLDEIITRKKLKQIIVDVSLAQKNNTFIITRGKFEKGCTEIAKNNVTLLDVEKLAAYLVNLRLVHSHSESQAE